MNGKRSQYSNEKMKSADEATKWVRFLLGVLAVIHLSIVIFVMGSLSMDGDDSVVNGCSDCVTFSPSINETRLKIQQGCTPGWSEEYRCNGNVVEREWVLENCNWEYRTWKDCNEYSPPQKCVCDSYSQTSSGNTICTAAHCEEACTHGATETRKCIDNVAYRLYIDEHCREVWRVEDDCNSYKPPKQCLNGICQGCLPGATQTYRCFENQVQQLVRDSQCKEAWQTKDDCNRYSPPRKCMGGVCVEVDGRNGEEIRGCDQAECQSWSRSIGVAYPKDGETCQRRMECNCEGSQCRCQSIEECKAEFTLKCPADVTLDCGESIDPYINSRIGIPEVGGVCDGGQTNESSDPAEAYCKSQGYNYRDGICYFPNGTSCDAWEFYRGVCVLGGQIGHPDPAAVFCLKSGGRLESKQTPEGETGICILPDGTSCEEWSYFYGKCGPRPPVPPPRVRLEYSDSVSGMCPKIISRNWTARDGCGNVTSCIQTITIRDAERPVITCPPDITVEYGSSIDPSKTGVATTRDDCDPNPKVTYKDSEKPGSYPQSKIVTRTWTATDACRNSASCNQSITVKGIAKLALKCPPNVILECNQSIDYEAGSASVEGSCNVSSPFVWSEDRVLSQPCPNSKVINRTYWAMDACGNSARPCNQTITVRDITKPVLTCPPDVIVEPGQPTGPDKTGLATAKDNCDPNPMVTYLDSTKAGPGLCSGFIKRTWTATDACGNSARCTQTITIKDRTKPVIKCPATLREITIECGQPTDSSGTGGVSAKDNCDPNPRITYKDTVKAGACPRPKIIIRTWTATDASGNSATCDQTIFLTDKTKPVIACPPDVILEFGQPTDPGKTGTATARDNCDPKPKVTYSDSHGTGPCPCSETIIRTWTATDACGNSASCNQTITIKDATRPEIKCPPEVTIDCGESMDPEANQKLGNATATDNCDLAPMVTYKDSEKPGSCPQSKVITRTWMATDSCGNSASCAQTITVKDTTKPAITCPAEVTIECGQPIDPSKTGMATAKDNCDPSPKVTYKDSEKPGSCPQSKVITRTWTATDACGNYAICNQSITIRDTTKPVITCPPNVTVKCSRPIYETSAFLPPDPGRFVKVKDDCDPNPKVTYKVDVKRGACDYSGVIIVIWTATDACGNSASCTQTITVGDTTKPVITCPTEVVIECGQPTDPSKTGMATAKDNCDPNPKVTYKDSEKPGPCPQSKVITRTWTATDACGNSASCAQTITVKDTTKPAITCPPTITIECGQAMDPGKTGMATAKDNCDPNPKVIYTTSKLEQPGGCPRILRTWTATDACGNSASCAQTITIKDAIKPEIKCPPEVTIDCGESADPDANPKLGKATATDNCDPNPKVTYKDSEKLGPCLQSKVITRTWTATDACGNSASCTQTITIKDATKPDIKCPPEVTIDCGESADPDANLKLGKATATDNCDRDPKVTYKDSEKPGSCPQSKVITRTWTATDACGNSASCAQTITVKDATKPAITCPAEVTIECGQPIDPSKTGTATARDNCDPMPKVTYKDSEKPGSCPQSKVITRTWTATDACGNSADCTQTITVRDTTKPVIACPPAITVECGQPIDSSKTGMATAKDNCDPNPKVTYKDSEKPGSCPSIKVITRTWTAADACGNSASCTQTITVKDTTKPAITCPARVIIEWGQPTDPSKTGMATAKDNCDPNPKMTYKDSEKPGSCSQPKVITRTWTATDACSNSASCDQIIEMKSPVMKVEFIEIGKDGVLTENNPLIRLKVIDGAGKFVSGVKININNPEFGVYSTLPDNPISIEERGEEYIITYWNLYNSAMALRADYNFNFEKNCYPKVELIKELIFDPPRLRSLDSGDKVQTIENRDGMINPKAIPKSTEISLNAKAIMVDGKKYCLLDMWHHEGNKKQHGFLVADRNGFMPDDERICKEAAFTGFYGAGLRSTDFALLGDELNKVANTQIVGEIILKIRKIASQLLGEAIASQVLAYIKFADMMKDSKEAKEYVDKIINMVKAYKKVQNFVECLNKDIIRGAAALDLKQIAKDFKALSGYRDENLLKGEYDNKEVNYVWKDWKRLEAGTNYDLTLIQQLNPPSELMGQLWDVAKDSIEGAIGVKIKNLPKEKIFILNVALQAKHEYMAAQLNFDDKKKEVEAEASIGLATIRGTSQNKILTKQF